MLVSAILSVNRNLFKGSSLICQLHACINELATTQLYIESTNIDQKQCNFQNASFMLSCITVCVYVASYCFAVSSYISLEQHQTHGSMLAAKKTRNRAPHTSVLFMRTMI